MKTYIEAHKLAQREADADGFDRGLEVLRVKGQPDNWHVFMLPARHHRQGHETRCEVVMCSDLARCRPGHGPEAPAPLSMWDKLKIARQHGALLDSIARMSGVAPEATHATPKR